MPAESALEARLRQRWSKKGLGPDIEVQLRATQALLEQREAELKAKSRGVAHKVQRDDTASADPPLANSTHAAGAHRSDKTDEGSGTAPGLGRAIGQATQQAQNRPATTSDDTTAHGQGEGRGAPESAGASASEQEVFRLKDAGNKALGARDYAAAVKLYTQALATVGESIADDDDGRQIHAALYCNRAAAYIKLSKWAQAAKDAMDAGKLRPDWPKPLYRLAQALSGGDDHVKAMAVCREGERLLERLGDHSREFAPLMDQVTTAAALAGCLEVFDGREIRVRTAGDDAWLCLPAPPTAAEIEAEKRGTAALAWDDGLGLLALTGSESAAAAQVLSAEAAAEAARKQAALRTLSVRSVREAMEKARDGDVIVFEDGPHNVGGDAVVVDKRVLIRSEHAAGDSPVEQRGNAPAFRITRTAVLKDLDLDLCGFRACILVQGDTRCTPVIFGCKIRSSGDHGFVAEGRCAPVVRRCDIRGRHAGVCTFDSAAPVFENCKISDSDKQGIRACDKSRPKLQRCALDNNGHEGVVSMDAACVSLSACSVSGNRGPGLDISGDGQAIVAECTVKGNCGGVFLWDDAKCVLQRTYVEGGPSHAILADEHSRPHVRQCRIKGEVHALSSKAAEGIAPAHNAMLSGDSKSQLPPESGCFKFEADRFTRKQ